MLLLSNIFKMLDKCSESICFIATGVTTCTFALTMELL